MPAEREFYTLFVVDIAVIGTGYVGLSTGACFSHLGHRVTCVDVDVDKVLALSRGQVPIAEYGLDDLVSAGLGAGTLSFTTDLQRAVGKAQVVFLCVPTPQADDGSADLSFVWTAVGDLAPHLDKGTVVVNKSTVPVGTAQHVAEMIGRSDISVVSNPEFLRQGTAVHDFLHPNRIVIGGHDPVAVETVAGLYEGVNAPVLRMSAESAETLKYAANSLLATKLTFINAMADICEAVGADIFEVSAGIGLDPRIGRDMLNAGPGWGGSCFPKDTRALVKIAEQGGYDFALLRGVIETNDRHYERIAEKVIAVCGGSVAGLTVAGWGLTFKAGTDDLRDSPAIKILAMLRDAGASVRAHDPTARGRYRAHPWIEVAPTALDACKGADVLAVLTEWPEYGRVSPSSVRDLLSAARVVDGRNVLDRESWREVGFEYRGVGR
ncbi:MAG: UDP-glucose dehydrogenase family protein [Acidimicrobiales bacterium]